MRVLKPIKRLLSIGLCAVTILGLAGCSSNGGTAFTGGKKIIRISHAQSETHPEHIGLLAFKEYIEENLGDKYVVAGTANLETFADVYEVFSMPYLFTSEEAYHATMEDTDYMEQVYESTDEAGFRVLTWYNAGTRNIYATSRIDSPDDLHGLKIRVQQSPASVAMIEAFGAAASPMSFGEVYTAIQQGVIDGAENNELALTNNKHGEVAKYYTYTMHQMVPDMLIGNLKFLNSLSDEELEIFKEAARISTEVELEEWDAQAEEAREIAENDMGVEFINVDINEFKEQVEPLHEQMLEENEHIRDLYDHIQVINAEYTEEGGN